MFIVTFDFEYWPP